MVPVRVWIPYVPGHLGANTASAGHNKSFRLKKNINVVMVLVRFSPNLQGRNVMDSTDYITSYMEGTNVTPLISNVYAYW